MINFAERWAKDSWHEVEIILQKLWILTDKLIDFVPRTQRDGQMKDSSIFWEVREILMMLWIENSILGRPRSALVFDVVNTDQNTRT